MKRAFIPICVLLSAVSGSPVAGPVHFSSGIEQNQLIELYTSEGCSSCPPAEAWLNNLQNHPRLWDDVIPVAFHVDYWNDLGWEDRFSSPVYSARQRAYARHWRARTVYTPAFVVNGREWRRWFNANRPEQESDKVGNLSVQVQGDRLTANFRPETALSKHLVLHVALLGINRTTQIRAGEREGEATIHHFVVLGHKSVKSDSHHWQTRLPSPQSNEAGKLALAIWVTEDNNLVPIQSTGGFIGR